MLPEDYRSLLASASYVCDSQLATALTMADHLSRPLLLEGEAGVGKTAVAKALAEATDRHLIRLQCYEGLDASQAIYEWNYQRQILAIANARSTGTELENSDLFADDFLLKRPLLQAITNATAPILLIDEVDRSDEEFEAYLLELLADYQITIPEIGTIKASTKPFTILTSNGSRELSDALRRRCLYHYIDFPDIITELQIIRAQAPGCPEKLARRIAEFIQRLRQEDLKKKPGVAETLDWTAALVGLDMEDLSQDPEVVHKTLMCVLKTRDDREAIPQTVFERLASL